MQLCHVQLIAYFKGDGVLTFCCIGVKNLAPEPFGTLSFRSELDRSVLVFSVSLSIVLIVATLSKFPPGV